MSGFHAEIDADGALRLVLPGVRRRIRTLGRDLPRGGRAPAECPLCLSVELSAEEDAALARLFAGDDGAA